MAANPPTKPPDAPAAGPSQEKTAEQKAGQKPEQKMDRFRPEMPQIPGVTSGARPSQGGLASLNTEQIVQIAAVVAAVILLVALIVWRSRSKPRAAAPAAADADTTEQSAPPPAPEPVIETPEANLAATEDQLSKPWAAHKFTFVKPITQDSIDAMVIRLPNGGLWAFSLQAPFGRCDLEFVTDIDVLASKYNFNASHPMVVNPCDSTVYDPLKVGPLGANTWARGEIVHGSSLRPPISIDVKVRGRSIIADSIE